jgi:RNA polymerase sigma-70 factor (ECF subfamily)
MRLEDLIRRIQHGDWDLVAVLYERSFDRVYGYVYSLVGNVPDAEDVTQQTFEAMLDALTAAEIRDPASFNAWLFAVARSRAIDHQRSQDRLAPTPPDDMIQRLETSQSSGDERAQEPRGDTHFDVELTREIRRLPPLAREVVLLRYVGDFDLAAIAVIVGVSEDSVKQAHRRALSALRDRLAPTSPTRRRLRPLEMRQLTRLPGSR